VEIKGRRLLAPPPKKRRHGDPAPLGTNHALAQQDCSTPWGNAVIRFLHPGFRDRAHAKGADLCSARHALDAKGAATETDPGDRTRGRRPRPGTVRYSKLDRGAGPSPTNGPGTVRTQGGTPPSDLPPRPTHAHHRHNRSFDQRLLPRRTGEGLWQFLTPPLAGRPGARRQPRGLASPHVFSRPPAKRE